MLLMCNMNFHCEMVENPDTQKFRAEIYELPARELVASGPWAATAKGARRLAVVGLRAMLYAAEGIAV